MFRKHHLYLLTVLNLLITFGVYRYVTDKKPTRKDNFQRDQVIYHTSDLVITAIDSPGDMWKLRELVGSIHRHNFQLKVHVYASLPNPNDHEEISGWQNVTVFNYGLSFFGQLRDDIKVNNICSFMDDQQFIELGWQFTKYTNVLKFPKECKPNNHFKFVETGLEVARNLKSANHNSQLNRCWLKHKTELYRNSQKSELISDFASEEYKARFDSWGKKKVALLVPTYTSAQPFLYSVLIPSLLDTITTKEYSEYLVTLYIGYDGRDPVSVFDFSKVVPPSTLIVKKHRLPALRWATAMWNGLFIDSLNDKNDYFFQLGDDIRFHQKGWLSAMTNSLDSVGGWGMVGPKDTRWGCKIITQAMVTRRHYEIFGWFYPPEIKDWFSDNWLQKTYETIRKTQCINYTMSNNSGLNQRYEECDNVYLANESLTRHLKTLKAKLKAH